MEIIKTEQNETEYGMHKFVDHTIVENFVNYKVYDVNANGLSKKYTLFNFDNEDCPWWYPISAGAGRPFDQQFSFDNREILKKYLFSQMYKKEKINIVEIGIDRSGYSVSSTGVFLKNKRHQDFYVGIDIVDKSNMNDQNHNIFTICSPSQNKDLIFSKFKEIGIETIDILMIDGHHSINQVYLEWEIYTPLLSKSGIVVMHDTNSHPGPYFLMKSIDTNQYNVYKYLSDVLDWGIGVAVRK